MIYTHIRNYTISKLTLGTVGLGMDYGISNRTGIPASETIAQILSTAIEGGINMLDTARIYGSAEKSIGDFRAKKNLGDTELYVTTKFKIKKNYFNHPERLYSYVKESVQVSLKNLRLTQIPICLLHMERDLPGDEVVKILPYLLNNLKQDGLISMGGVSADHPSEVVYFIDDPNVEVLQVPMNIFDLRLINTGLLKQLQKRDKIIFARSIFLQGLFFMQPVDLPPHLTEAGRYITQFQQIAMQENMSTAQLAFSFVRDAEGVSSIIFGAVTPGQVVENISLLQTPSISANTRSQIQDLFADIPEFIITPGLW